MSIRLAQGPLGQQNIETTSGFVEEISDDFNRANSSTLGGGWESPDGNWAISGNQASQSTGASDLVRYTGTALSSTDQYVRATRWNSTTGAVTVCLRMNSAKTQFYMAGFNTSSSQWIMWRYNGSFTTIASASGSVGANEVYFRLQAIGSDLSLWVGNPAGTTPVQVLTATDSTFAHDYVGIRGNSTGGTVNVLDDFAAGIIA